MLLSLSYDDIRTLEQLLDDYLPALKFEAARTQDADARHILIRRQALCEELLDQLTGLSTGW